MAKNNIDLEDLLGLTDKKIEIELDVKQKEPEKGTLEYDLWKMIEGDGDKYLKELIREKEKEEEFIRLFRVCFDSIIRIIQSDPAQRIAVNCAGCRWSNNFVGNGYGKATTIRNSTNGRNPNKEIRCIKTTKMRVKPLLYKRLRVLLLPSFLRLNKLFCLIFEVY